jgi:hypothetical protein
MNPTDAARRVGNEATLYPEIEPYASGRIALDGVHTMHWETCGNPAGVPLVSCTAARAADACRTTAASTIPRSSASCSTTSAAAARPLPPPRSSTTRRSTWSTTSSACAIARRSSAGCCSADRGARRSRSPMRKRIPSACWARAARHLPRVAREIDWFMHGMRNVFPEAWRAFAAFLPPDERDDLLGSYYRRLTDADPRCTCPRRSAWDRYEGACSTLLPQPDSHRQVRRATPHERSRFAATRCPLLRASNGFLPARRRAARGQSRAIRPPSVHHRPVAATTSSVADVTGAGQPSPARGRSGVTSVVPDAGPLGARALSHPRASRSPCGHPPRFADA